MALRRDRQIIGNPLYGFPIFIVLLALLAPAACAADATDLFLKRHWAFPIPFQGKPPKSFTPLEASLAPEDCAACHAKQYQDWRTSLHAHAMGPGVMGQLLSIEPDATEALRDCTRCHAPLAEQEASLKKQLRGNKQTNGHDQSPTPVIKNTIAITAPSPQPSPARGEGANESLREFQNIALHQQGLVCAACHVRRHVRYGPPPLQTSTTDVKPHGGFVVAKAFQDGRFCATCHQFGADGYALNGKPLENTYAEWQTSPYPARGVQCQGCHMPERRHVWRGIHDAEMTRKGVTIDATPPVSRSGRLGARLSMTNSGTGHAFPTYVTPRVLMQMYQLDADGKIIESTLRQRVIARQVSADLSEELADTRILPGESALLEYNAPRHSEARELVYRVRVEPDYFYTGVYRSLLESQPQGSGAELIGTALKNSLDSHYDLYLVREPLTR